MDRVLPVGWEKRTTGISRHLAMDLEHCSQRPEARKKKYRGGTEKTGRKDRNKKENEKRGVAKKDWIEVKQMRDRVWGGGRQVDTQ